MTQLLNIFESSFERGEKEGALVLEARLKEKEIL
jgi:hypothetical protein